MPKRRAPDERKMLDPEDVLARRVKVGAAELLDLIHRVNPTGRELGTREAELRYAQKARLQSLLVRRFGPELSVVAAPAYDGTVSILHRGHGRDGCHAVVDALDEDARAWVQLQLDVGPPSSEAPAPTAPAPRPSGRGAVEEAAPSSADASPESLVRHADDAVESYDFVRARAYLERAVAASGGAAEPAAALLALLVETLGDDTSARALVPSLSRAALAHPNVRAFLALAAARLGDAGQAIELMRGAHPQRTAEVSASLAARAVEAGNAEQAAAHLGDVRRRDPAHPAIVGLADEIARLRAAARGPLEAALSALVAAGHEEEAERKAAEVLLQWPDSEAARRIVRAGAERRRGAKEAAEQRAREMEASLLEKQEALRVDQVRAQLAAADPREGLIAWLDLEPALRRRVGETGAAELCRWLDLTPARAASPARVEAVLAVGVARQRLASDPQGAIDALAAHESMLERVPEARRITREAHAVLAAERTLRARAEVLAARGDLAEGNAASALLRLDASLRSNLDDEARAEAEALRAEAARILAHEKRVAEVGRLRRTGHLFEARALAEELLAEAPAAPPEHARWEQERQAIQGEIQRAFRVEIDLDPRPFGEEPSPDAAPTMMDAPVWLTEDGRTLVLAEGQWDRVWVQLVDVESRTVRAQMVLRTPERLEGVVFHVVGSTAWLTSQRGALLVIDVERLTVELFRPAREIVPAGLRAGAVAIAAERGAARPRYYWIQPADEEHHPRAVRVIDLETGRVAREVADVGRLAALAGMREARVACMKQSGVVLHEDRGVPVPGGRFPRQEVAVVLATVHPSGEGIVGVGAIARTPWMIERDPAPGSRRKKSPQANETPPSLMGIIDLSADRRTRAPWTFDVGEGTMVGLASSRDTGLVGIMVLTPEPRWELFVLRPTGGTFELLHRTEVPGRTVMVRDAGARHLFAYSASPLGLVPIGCTAPNLPAATPTEEDAPIQMLLATALHAAEARLDAGDPEGALAALRFDAGDEVQVLARKAEAWLALSPPSGQRRFEKIMGLAEMLEVHHGSTDAPHEEVRPTPEAMWDRSHLDDVARRAAAWLSAHEA